MVTVSNRGLVRSVSSLTHRRCLPQGKGRRDTLRRCGVILAFAVVFFCGSFALGLPAVSAHKPSVLIINEKQCPSNNGDFTYLNELHAHGFQIDQYFNGQSPLTWERLRRHHCLVVISVPFGDSKQPENAGAWKQPPFRAEMQLLLKRYLAAGGGVFFMPNTMGYEGTLTTIKNYEAYLITWGVRMPLDMICDPATQAFHPRNRVPFVYTQAIAPSPVSEGVKGIWFPSGDGGWSFSSFGSPIDVSADWTPVVSGSPTSYTEPMAEVGHSSEHDLLATMFHRSNPKTPPTLFAIRDKKPGRMAVCTLRPVFTFRGGTAWIHDGAVLNKGMAGRSSNFGRLVENTLRWLAEPSLKSGKLGGYVQDPKQLVQPNLRKTPDEFFSQLDAFQNVTAPGRVYRGLIGARTRYSTGQGTVVEYAQAAKEAKLDFVVFLEEFGKKGGLTEAKYRQLEADCKRHSSDRLLLLPGFTFRNNIGNHLFVYGYDLKWPTRTQFIGPNGDELRHQCFDKDGNLTESDEDAKNWIWPLVFVPGRNLGYYNFANSPDDAMPVRDLRLFGILGVMTYQDGKLVEDLTPEYLTYVMDGNPPLACAVEIVQIPADLVRAVREKHYLTHVAAAKLADLPIAMHYGHQYGRANVNPSSGPQIKSWAGTQRVMTYGGESFVPARYRIRPQAWVVSEVGLREIKIWDDRKVIRRILLNGAKEFKRTFEWAYDRQRVNVLEVVDMEGHRALSAGFESWCDANYNGWCGDRQNGELWHGPLTVPGPRLPAMSVGPTWDGGPPPPASASYNIHPGLQIKSGLYEGFMAGMGGRFMEGDMWPTCVNECVNNVAAYGDHNYAPGQVYWSYHTLGPIKPSEFMTFTVRRTQYLQRLGGVSPELHPMHPERVGGNLAMVEGTMIFKKDTPVENVNILWAQLANFPKDESNIPLFGIRRGNDDLPFCGPLRSLYDSNCGIPPSLGAGSGNSYRLDSGGFFTVLPTGEGIVSALFNIGKDPIGVRPRGDMTFELPVGGQTFKVGQSLDWRYLVVMESVGQSIHNLHRIERIRQYYGLDGKHDSGLKVKRGKLLSHFGIVDLAPEKGVVEFQVPAPDFPLQLPLGLRFIGFNSNWTLGQLQISGYSTGYYTNGSNVYRNLATDDRGMAYLAVYPDNVSLSHSIVGHPVQCDDPKLVIEFTQLGVKPLAYHVAVNNPTDVPITTTLRKGTDLPGFEFPDQPITVGAGAYLVIRER